MSPDSEPETLSPPVFVDDPEGLAALAAALDGAREIALDTEADSFFSYEEKVCLLQVTVGGIDYIVDPLAGLDLEPLRPSFEDPSKVKILHDAEFDLFLMQRCWGFRLRGLFDTRAAAAALGYEAPGLASVLERHFGVQLDKKEQRSDWSRRPLTESQVAYARLDTHYLSALRERMAAELEEAGRLEVLEGECLRLEAQEPPVRGFDPDGYARIKGARTVKPQGLAILRELFVLRDEVARERDVPPFKVLANPVLLDLAQRAPRSLGALEGLRGFPRGRMGSLGRRVLAAVERGLAAEPIRRLPAPAKTGSSSLSDEAHELHERLRTWRRDAAIAADMDSSLVLHRLALLRLAEERPADAAALAAVEGIQAWQARRHGDDLLALVRAFEDDLAAGRIELDRRRRRR